MKILGLSFAEPGSAAALIADGRVLAAAEEERFSRVLGDAAFPDLATAFCLSHAGFSPADLDGVVFFAKPLLRFERMITQHLFEWPRFGGVFARQLQVWLGKNLKNRSLIRDHLGYAGPIYYADRREAQAAAAFTASAFREATVLTVGGEEDWATTSVHHARDGRLEERLEIRFPDSLGGFYRAFARSLACATAAEFSILAQEGRPLSKDRILQDFITLLPDGSFRLKRECFEFAGGEVRLAPKAARNFLGLQDRADLAASLLGVLEQAVIAAAQTAVGKTGCPDLCFTGDLAGLPTVVAKLKEHPAMGRLFVPEAIGSASGVVGAALLTEALISGHGLKTRATAEAAWGPEFSADEIASYLVRAGIPYETFANESIQARANEFLKHGKSLGWFQGRMPLGEHAQGLRGILRLGEEARTFAQIVTEAPLRSATSPVACTPQDAFACFAETGLDAIFLGPYLVRRENLPYLRGNP